MSGSSGMHTLLPPLNIRELISEHSYIWGICCSKLSVLFFYRRLISGINNKRFYLVNVALIVLVLGYSLPLSLANFFACKPVDAYWRQFSVSYAKVQEFRCINISMISYTASGFSVATDFLITLFPLWFIRRLHMARKQKLGIALIFGVGFL